ncbi:type VII secretion protein EccB [Amycolatopsis sp. H20-H5]|uniref:type VII secretion protein EccB n=1 Tax=Amycolatopsis sp. H20-H5 TaxID=3046309 RepID=UPI002DB5DF74|nr:type VII secretion protein EccB [Amycolatopsis sp. H20-H5]MEC3979121.1 type VII secretion protein EccB [Amycolatopsis sp. H20-H5]
MPSTPTTKSQVQAYKFVLRRMQSALVRRDAVMLHDPMRTHTRATIVGVVLGGLGMVVFIVWGLLSPAPTVPQAGNIVIGEQSGTVYVVTGNPIRLIPTFNLASARLYLMAQKQQAAQQAGGSSGAPAPAAAAPAAPDVKNATVVSDEQLKNIPRGKLTGIPDGPQLMPTDNQLISPDWAVCDEVKLDPQLPVPDSINKTETTVFAGVPNLGARELGENEALLANADNGKNYLIYRLQASPNQPNANTVRAEIDPGKSYAVSSALKLPAKGRKISRGLLNAIPEVAQLTSPQITGQGAQPTGFSLDGLTVGQVFETQPTAGPADSWVIAQDGIQKISPAAADILRAGRGGSNSPPTLGLDKLSNVKVLGPTDNGYLAVGDYPRTVPVVLDATKGSPVSCLGWSLTGADTSLDSHTSVFVSDKLPGPKYPDGTSKAVKVSTRGPNGLPIDGFYMPSGFAAVVQSATNKATFGKGAIQLISDRGIRYGVPDVATANGIGLGNRKPAPETIIGLLPPGSSLNTQAVRREFDTVPIDPNAGSFPSSTAAAPAGN